MSRKTVMAVVGAFLLGGVVGGASGGIVGANLGAGAVVTSWALTDGHSAAEMVDSLELLRAKKSVEAIDLLELHLNRHLVSLRPVSWEGAWVSENVPARAEETRIKAKRYRDKHPRPESKSMLEQDVKRFLDGESKPK